MINKFKGYDDITITEGGKSLEPGGYELKIINAKVENVNSSSGASFQILKIAFDVVNNSEYEGIFAEKFKAAKSKDMNAKWNNCGVFDVFIPTDDGSESDFKTKTSFKRFITSVENSNQGYIWDWNELSLKGKMFGGVFGREQFRTKEGELKFSVKCRYARSIDGIRTGNYIVPEDKLLKGTSTPPSITNTANLSYSTLSDFEDILSDGDAPF